MRPAAALAMAECSTNDSRIALDPEAHRTAVAVAEEVSELSTLGRRRFCRLLDNRLRRHATPPGVAVKGRGHNHDGVINSTKTT